MTLQGLNAVKPQMIEEATKNARAAAIKFAKDSDSELGKIKKSLSRTIQHRRPRCQYSLYQTNTRGDYH